MELVYLFLMSKPCKIVNELPNVSTANRANIYAFLYCKKNTFP